MNDRRSDPPGCGRALLTVAALVVIAIQLSFQLTRPGPEDVHLAVRNAATELRRTAVDEFGISSSDVRDALEAGNPAGGFWRLGIGIEADLELRSAGADYHGELFEITRDDGAYPVCLVVSDGIATVRGESRPLLTTFAGPCSRADTELPTSPWPRSYGGGRSASFE